MGLGRKWSNGPFRSGHTKDREDDDDDDGNGRSGVEDDDDDVHNIMLLLPTLCFLLKLPTIIIFCHKHSSNKISI